MTELRETELESYSSQKRTELMMSMLSKKLMEEVTATNERVESLVNEITALRSQLSDIQSSPAKPQESRVIKQESKEQNQEVQTTIVEENKTENIKTSGNNEQPRYGEFKPGDVPVEKYFYFGKK